jgi:hypothetical protein
MYYKPSFDDAQLKIQDDTAQTVYNTYIKDVTDTACQTATKKALCLAYILSCGGRYAVTRAVCPSVCKAAEDACPADTFGSTGLDLCSDRVPLTNPCFSGSTALKGSIVLMVVAFIATMVF